MNTLRTSDPATAAAILRRGGLVAFATETVYGLGADGLSAAAVRAVFAAKGRPADNPLILHLADPGDAPAVGVWTPTAADLARRYWPGPLTLVVPACAVVPPEARGGLATVALRCPGHAQARDLIARVGHPLAAPSANRSGRPSPTTADAAWEELAGRIDAVLEGGPCALGIESTVVDCCGPLPVLLRLGAVPAEELGLAPVVGAGAAGRSPGTTHAHYAPAVRLHLCSDLGAGLRLHPQAAVLCAADDARRCGLSGPAVRLWAEDAAGRAAQLFGTLRALERAGRPCILATTLPEAGLDAATMDRLRRAAAAAGVLD